MQPRSAADSRGRAVLEMKWLTWGCEAGVLSVVHVHSFCTSVANTGSEIKPTHPPECDKIWSESNHQVLNFPLTLTWEERLFVFFNLIPAVSCHPVWITGLSTALTQIGLEVKFLARPSIASLWRLNPYLTHDKGNCWGRNKKGM